MNIATSVGRLRLNALACTALASGMALPDPALAQSSPQPQSGSPVVGAGQSSQNDSVQEIIVTAQKRAQRLQDVPVAVTALTGDALAGNRVQNVSDLSGLAPNVQVRPAAGGTAIPAFSSRGLVSYGVVPGSDKEFSIYLDGVYIGSSRASLFDIPDITRVEVLRGPQGTLFGRNSTTGAMSIVTRDPTGQLGLKAEMTLGNEAEFRIRTTVDLPQAGPFSGYVTYMHDEHRGDIRNLGAGTVWDRTGPATNVGVQRSPQWLGSKDEDSVFAALKFESGNFKTIYKFDYTINHFTPDGIALIGLNTSTPLFGSLFGALVASQPTPFPIDPSAQRPDAVNNSFATPGLQKNYGHNLTSTWAPTDNLSFKNVAAYRYALIRSGSQLDGLGGLQFTGAAVVPASILAAYSAYPVATAAAHIGDYIPYYTSQIGNRYVGFGLNNETTGKQWSDELQGNYTSKLLTLTIGGLYFHQVDQAGAPLGLPNNEVFTVIPNSGRIPLGNESISYNRATSIAGYAQAEIHITPVIDLVAGGRITHDDKSGSFVDGGTYVSPSGTNPDGTPVSYTDGTLVGTQSFPFTYHATKFTYSAGVNYKPSRDLLAYAKYSTGFVSGGSVGAVPFAEETVGSAEAGVKTDFLNRRITTNIALFYANYKNIQSSQGGTAVGHPELGTVVISAGDAKAYGAEFETTVVPVNGLTLNGSFGYTHVTLSNVPDLLITSNDGTYLPNLIPKFTVGLSGQYETRPIIGDATLIARVDSNWHDKELAVQPGVIAAAPALAPIGYLPAVWIVNTRLTLHNLGPGHLDVSFWTRNLTNDKSPLFPLELLSTIAASDFQPARTYGVDLAVRF